MQGLYTYSHPNCTLLLSHVLILILIHSDIIIIDHPKDEKKGLEKKYLRSWAISSK